MSDRDRSRQPLFVLGAGAVLLGAAALLFALIAGPGPASRAPTPAVTGYDAAAPAAAPPAEPSDPFHTGALSEPPANPDHPPAGPVTGGPEPAPMATIPVAQPEPASEVKPVEAEHSEAAAASEPADAAVANAESADQSPQAPSPAGEEKASAAAVPEVTEVTPEPATTMPAPPEESLHATAPKAPAPGQQPAAAPETKIAAVEAKPEPAPMREAEKPKEPVAAPGQGTPNGKLLSKPMALGAGGGLTRQRIGAPSARAGAGNYAARVRGAIGRHRLKASGGGSATVTFAIGPAGVLRGVRISRSSGKPLLDQAALASVRNAAPFPPPPAGLTAGDLTYTIQIFFR